MSFTANNSIRTQDIRDWTKGKTMSSIYEMRFDSIIPSLKVNNRKQLLQKLAKHTSKLIGTPEKLLFDNLMEAELNENSSIGNGVALPHYRLPRLTRSMFVYARLENSIEYGAADQEPVDLVCLVLSPEHEGPIHLRRLAKAARFFGNNDFRSNLRQAQTIEDTKLALSNINTVRKAA